MLRCFLAYTESHSLSICIIFHCMCCLAVSCTNASHHTLEGSSCLGNGCGNSLGGQTESSCPMPSPTGMYV